jgi:hypothetical protein
MSYLAAVIEIQGGSGVRSCLLLVALDMAYGDDVKDYVAPKLDAFLGEYVF